METLGEFAKIVYAGVNRLRTFEVVDPNLGVDLFIYCTGGEVGQESELAGVTRDILDGYLDKRMVRGTDMFFQKPELGWCFDICANKLLTGNGVCGESVARGRQ